MPFGIKKLYDPSRIPAQPIGIASGPLRHGAPAVRAPAARYMKNCSDAILPSLTS